MIRRGKRIAGHGFTLTEMLVVIAVIAILAGMVLAVLPGVTEKRTRSVVRAELAMLVGAIEYYKEKHGFYPPDNAGFDPQNTPKQVGQPPLFYELVGTQVIPGPNRDSTFYESPLTNGHKLSATQVKNKFGGENRAVYDGFSNSSTDLSEVKNFLPTLKDRQWGPSPFDSTALILKVPAKGPPHPNFPTDVMNPWKYVVAKPTRAANDPYPTNNPNSFDLWADVDIRGKTVSIGNWKQEK